MTIRGVSSTGGFAPLLPAYAGAIAVVLAVCLVAGFLSIFDDDASYSLPALFGIGLVAWPVFAAVTFRYGSRRWLSASLAIVILPLGGRVTVITVGYLARASISSVEQGALPVGRITARVHERPTNS